ncbi:MAG TPA: redoxin domain-containing protein [Solirubrobacteraceae bacterium]|nr:redoxin domain-containing protein [Solirubrobacteraceae bacterium]
MTRPPSDDIQAPPFPRMAVWVNASRLRMEEQRGHPVLVEFWDFCRPNSIRTLPYLSGWHERYRDAGLLVIGVHSAGFPPGSSPRAVRRAVARLGIAYPVLVDSALEVWREYENLGWPARYLFGPDGMLYEYHFGEGGYAETERAIQELLGLEREPLAPVRPEDDPDAVLAVQSDDVAGPYSGPYEAGEVWAVLEPREAAPPDARVVRARSVSAGEGAGAGEGTAAGERTGANGETGIAEAELRVDHPGAYRLFAHRRSTAGELSLELGEGVVCHAVCFTPGLAR